ncbi:uncharacterized protein METZ01_LOCUS403682, partial [marine metagenome]
MIYFAYWSFTRWIEFNDNAFIFYFVLSILSFLSLLFYSRKFIRKYRSITG